MKRPAPLALIAPLVLIAALVLPAGAAERLRMATIDPGSSAYLVMTTMASAINRAQEDLEITVDATGAATKHVVEAAEGKIDLAMSSPVVHQFMKTGTGMYRKLERAPALSEKLGLIFWFPYGAYHAVAYADSGIERLEDIRGKRVFLGPPGGGAWATSAQWVEAVTGMKPGEDFENVKASWGAAAQGFQDRQIDVYFNGGIPPYPQIEQLAATSSIRLLGLTEAEVEAATEAQLKPTRGLGRSLDAIPAGTYGAGQVNAEDVYTVGSMVGVVARMDLDDEAVYRITKIFWEALPEIRRTAPYMARVTLETALLTDNIRLHPGARRYYEEIGLAIPDAMK